MLVLDNIQLIQQKTNTSKNRTARLIVGLLLLASFVLPWVNWEGTQVAGYGMASGDFFHTSATKFGLSNPFPSLSFAFYAFWLIPVLAILIIVLPSTDKKTRTLSFILGATSLSLVTIYIFFTGQLLELGVGKSLAGMMTPFIWLHALSAVALILFVPQNTSLLKKLAWLLVGPVIVFASFKLAEKYVMKETHKETANVKEDYTIKAAELIKEFIANDSASNKKYLEKMLVVNGNASAVEILADSTSTIKFEDSTGSYAIFSLDKTELNRVQHIKSGDAVSLKGVCSGSIFSEILGTTSINFKRATLNK